METKKEKTTKAEEVKAKEGQEPQLLAISVSLLKQALERVDEERIQMPMYSKVLMLSKTNRFWQNLEEMINVSEIFNSKGSPVKASWAQVKEGERPELVFYAPNLVTLLVIIREQVCSLAIFNRPVSKLDREIMMPMLGVESNIRGLSILATLLTIIIEDERWRINQAKEKEKENKPE